MTKQEFKEIQKELFVQMKLFDTTISGVKDSPAYKEANAYNAGIREAIRVMEKFINCPEIRIIIAGSRTFNDYELLKKSVFGVLAEKSSEQADGVTKITVPKDSVKIISGTARGADTLGEQFAEAFGLKLEKFPADWDKHGRRAGYIRNSQMAEHAMADGNKGILISFWDGQSKGTKHMIDIAESQGLEVHIVRF